MNDMLTADTKGLENEAMLTRYRDEVREELDSILSYWIKFTPDEQQGGFYGSINNDNKPDFAAPKGIVLNSRILWAFSAAYSFTGDKSNLAVAQKAFEYIVQHFVDHEHGGVFWSVDQQGKIRDGRKQVYGLAFCIYGMSEYYRATGNKESLRLANDLFECIEEYSHDRKFGGYLEAFARDWKPVADLRLSEKDDNEAKTMNTHLHIVEAYANLYSVQPGKTLRERIVDLLEIFDRHFINRKDSHLDLFMDDHWTVKSTLQSFGHDIEAAWLLLECAKIINYDLYINRFKELSVKLADAASQGVDEDGGLWYEFEPKDNHLVREKHSWPQAEAMVGFFNAYELTADKKYLERSEKSWEFVKNHIKDNENGEWFWGIYHDYSVMDKEKAGFWKCPYHNSRACMEIIRRIDLLFKT